MKLIIFLIIVGNKDLHILEGYIWIIGEAYLLFEII